MSKKASNGRLTIRLGDLTKPVEDYCEKHSLKQAELGRLAIAKYIGVEAPKMEPGNPTIGDLRRRKLQTKGIKIMKTAGYHSEGYGPGKSCHDVGEAGSTGSEGFVYVIKRKGVYRIADKPNRGAIPVELIGREVPCRVILDDDSDK